MPRGNADVVDALGVVLLRSVDRKERNWRPPSLHERTSQERSGREGLKVEAISERGCEFIARV